MTKIYTLVLNTFNCMYPPMLCDTNEYYVTAASDQEARKNAIACIKSMLPGYFIGIVGDSVYSYEYNAELIRDDFTILDADGEEI